MREWNDRAGRGSRLPIDLPRNVLENLLEGCQVISDDFRYLYVNAAVLRHGQTTRDALLGRRMSEAYPGIEETEMFAVLRRCMEERSVGKMENQFRYPDGSTAWFELRFEPVPEGLVVLSLDISDRKQAEASQRRLLLAQQTLSRCKQALIQSEDESEFVQQLCDILVDSGGYCGAWIGLAQSPDGHTLTLAASAGGDCHLDARDSAWSTELVARALETGEPALERFSESAEGTGDRGEKTSEHAVASCLCFPIQSHGRPLGALSICASDANAFDAEEHSLLGEIAHDVGHGIDVFRARLKLQRTEEELSAAQRLDAVGRLAGGVAHDFNNLLTVILSCTGMVLRQLDASHRVREDVEQVQQAGMRAADLTAQLLAFSRKQVLEPRSINLNGVIEGIESMLRRLVPEDIEIEMRLASDLGNVLADTGQLEQVAVNLVINARDSMPGGGKLTIATTNHRFVASEVDEQTPPGGYVELSVMDTGYGMSPEVQARVFEPFFTTKETGRGTGLGLATVYGIIKQSGGRILIDSEQGRGTIFKVCLPRTDGAPVEIRQDVPERAATGDETVLVVEDDAAVRAIAERILKGAGYNVLSAANGEQAVALCDEHQGPIGLLLTDVVMPLMSGHELAERLNTLRPGLRVLLMSGYPDAVATKQSPIAAETPLIRKPFTAVELTHKVRGVLDAADT